MNLIVLPIDGLAQVVRALRKAKESVRVTIFRCDLPEIEKALGDAVARGVAVHALIAQTNRTGEKALRKLELRLLELGLTVSRTADDLVRYHDKMIIVDERVLFVFGFNLTKQELSKRRSMGIVTRKRKLVNEALALFEADATRQAFITAATDLVISPVNARARLENTQAKERLKGAEAKVIQQVRDAGWKIEMNAKRIETTRAARELAEQRLDAERKRFEVGMSTSFLVIQAQRDLAQAKTNEVSAVLAYDLSLVDFEALQLAGPSTQSTAGSAPASSASATSANATAAGPPTSSR